MILKTLQVMEVCHSFKSQGINLERAKAILENDLSYMLHKPWGCTFPTLPVKVFTMHEQWTADLIEVINISKQNNGGECFPNTCWLNL